MTLFKGCHVVKCDESGKPTENEGYVQYKIIELANVTEWDPETKQSTDKVFALMQKVR